MYIDTQNQHLRMHMHMYIPVVLVNFASLKDLQIRGPLASTKSLFECDLGSCISLTLPLVLRPLHLGHARAAGDCLPRILHPSKFHREPLTHTSPSRNGIIPHGLLSNAVIFNKYACNTSIVFATLQELTLVVSQYLVVQYIQHVQSPVDLSMGALKPEGNTEANRSSGDLVGLGGASFSQVFNRSWNHKF